MKLVSFTVKDYRSITEGNQIDIGKITTIVGKNNEGKSNILKALNLAINILKDYHRKSTYGGKYRGESEYNWNRDYPIMFQTDKRRKQKTTVFKLTFSLSEEEIKEFAKTVQSLLNGDITIQISIGENNVPKVEIKKTGKFTKTKLGAQVSKITDYITGRINITYIPAIRTDEHAINIVENMLSLELGKIEEDENYKKALKTIEDLQLPILKSISEKVKKSLKLFIPDVKSVETTISEYQRRMSLRRNCEIFIDDGVKTNLEYKGDGMKSLVALSLLKDTSKDADFSLIAVEEPESHLHPGAIHTLRDTIYELSENNQVIISTHNPLFVNRENISSNIIVENGKAKLANKISTIRNVLGIKQSDNLMNANYVLVVEGEDDVVSLKAILSYESEKIKKAINDGVFVIESLGGGTNLSYKLSSLRNGLCSYYVFLDHDETGERAYKFAEEEGFLTIRDVSFSICNGMTESEFEDCLSSDLYKEVVLEKYGVDINTTGFRGSNKRSHRMKNVFLNNGKPWNDRVKQQLKMLVANVVSKNPQVALNQNKRSSIDALKISIENMIK